jgi:hypothetical protein
MGAQADMLSSSPPSPFSYPAQPYFFGGSEFNNFQITNSGSTTTITTVMLTGPDAAAGRFSFNGEFCSGQVLMDTQSCSVGVNFNLPNGPGNFSAQLEIASDNGTPSNPLVIQLSARALAGPAYSASPARVDFAPTLLGATSSQQVRITNVGDFQGGVQQAFVVGPNEFQIADDLCSQQPINPGESCTMTARFAPTAVREYQGSIFAIVSSANTPVLPINLSGQGRSTGAPAALITRKPPKNTRNTTASLQFTSFAENVRFECSLDKEPFTLCASPAAYVVKRGKHTFQVRARDTSGNVGTPAAASWRVAKQKNKKK